MIKKFLIAIIVLTPLLACVSQAADTSTNLVKQLEPMKPLLGKTWKGRFKTSTPEKPVCDVMKWERALNGQAIRILHSINDGAYGGETIMMWNPKAERVEFHYFTTAGFVTHGSVTAVEAGKITTHEEVTGNQEGVTEVKGTMEFLPNNQVRVKSQYLKNGAWVDGHEVTYDESPESEVRFK